MDVRLIIVFLFTCCGFRGCVSQVSVTTYSSKPSEVLRCNISIQKSYASWTEISAVDGSTIATIYEYNRGSGVTPTSPPTEGKYSNFLYQLNEDVNFDLVIENVNKDDGGIYSCIVIPGPVTTAYQVKVEALPLLVNTICSNSATCDGTNGMHESRMECTCTAFEVSPTGLQLEWSGASHTVGPFQETEAGDYFDLTSQATVNPTETSDEVTCSVTGYQSKEIEGTVNVTYKFAPPECTLLVDCGRAMVTCSCKGQSPYEVTYTFYDEKMQSIGVSTDNQMDVTAFVVLGESNTFSCWGCNGVFYGDSSLVSNTTFCPTNVSTFTPTTLDSEAGDDCVHSSAPALIVICCVEGLVIIVMISSFAFLYIIRKGSKNRNTQRFATTFHNTTDKINTAYMDLQETNQVSSNLVNVEIPIENLTLQASFPGNGAMIYRKAEMTLASKKEEIVVKNVSDHAPVKLEKLQADEIRKLTRLTSNVNVAKFLGRCNNVPNLLCFEFVNGTKLGEYLRENFQPSKIHQYSNTKQKRFHVPEKGSVESLPRVALQIARGMKYLTAHKFLHPGLRSEKVIIDVNGQCKLYDFVSTDNARDILAILWGKSVPYQWMPPEYLFLEKLDPLVDVWSFGVLMWEIFSYGVLPHEGKCRSDVEKELRGKENLPLPNNCPGAIWQITLSCWDQSPEKRPSFDNLSLQISHMCSDNKEYDEIQPK